jgi:hypothetical protein
MIIRDCHLGLQLTLAFAQLLFPKQLIVNLKRNELLNAIAVLSNKNNL